MVLDSTHTTTEAPTSGGWGIDLDKALGIAWGTLDKWLEGADARRKAALGDRANRRQEDRLREAQRLTDAREREAERLLDAREKALIEAERERDRWAAQLDRQRLDVTAEDEERDDDRALLDTRAGVWQDAFESRRGDTLISRLMWPAAVAVAVAGGIYLIRGAR